ncbi:MAG: hypoxanthine phosphoribosyltransferase [Bacteroidota bacterium]|jgi:hypoxanthine phosphoribosyltransferase
MLTIHDKEFVPYISADDIQARVRELAVEITKVYCFKTPLLIGVLNGSFMFAADLMKNFDFACEISFVKLQSYSGTASTGNVQTLIRLGANLENRHVIIVEDIIDTGRTLSSFMEEVMLQKPATVAIATLLLKPEALQTPIVADFCGFEIPNKFVVGYGLDYDGLGRNYPAIYQHN